MKIRPQHFHPQSAFTMVEVAISLAIIGVALVGIIGVLPRGLHAQRDSREATVINQDATIFMDAISKGAQGDNDLTNYVFAITNYWTSFNSDGTFYQSGTDGYSPAGSSITRFAPAPNLPITNGFLIVGLLSVPEFIDGPSGRPLPTIAHGGISNHIVAYVRSISGPAIEKPPQDNQILQQDSFSYRILCVNAPLAMDTNIYNLPPNQRVYADQLSANLHELRLTFEWPQLPNGKVGGGRQTYRTLVGGQVFPTSYLNQYLYFFQPQSFNNPPGNGAPPP